MVDGYETFEVAGAARPLGMDVFRPTGADLATAIVIFHGGGYRFGNRTAVHERARRLAAAGFCAIAAEYRKLDEAPWPAPLEDARAILEHVRAQAAALGIEPERIVVQGHSAGGHLALLVGPLVGAAAIVAYYPVIGFYPEAPPASEPTTGGPPDFQQAPDGTIPSYRVLGDDLDGEHIAAASPIRQIDGSVPPTLLFHGAADYLIAPFSSQIYYDRLVAYGVPADLHLYAGAVHEFDLAPSMLDACVAETAAFCFRHVVDPDGARAEARAANPTFVRD